MTTHLELDVQYQGAKSPVSKSPFFTIFSKRNLSHSFSSTEKSAQNSPLGAGMLVVVEGVVVVTAK